MNDIFLLALDDEPDSIDGSLAVLATEVKKNELGILSYKFCKHPDELKEYLHKAKAKIDGHRLPHIIIFDHIIERKISERKWLGFRKSDRVERIETIPDVVKEILQIHHCLCIGLSGVIKTKQVSEYVGASLVAKTIKETPLYDFIEKGNSEEIVDRLLAAIGWYVKERAIFE